MTTPNTDEHEEKLAKAFAKGLKLYQSEREEEEAKRKAAEGGDKGDGSKDGNGDSTGNRKSIAEWLLG